MATKQFLDLNGLSQYHDLITEYIGTEDAKSIKSISVSGNTVSFFKTADGSGTAAYTVNLPDVSGFMEKIANASGDKVVMSNSDGSVSESEIDVNNLALTDGTLESGYFVDFDGSMLTRGGSTELILYRNAIEWSGDGYILVNNYNDASKSAVNIDDVMLKIDSASGDKVLVSNSNGEAVESGTAIADLAQIGASGFTTGYIVTADSNGKLQATTDPSHFINYIAGATGGKIVTSTNDGQVAESNTAISDLATQTDLADKIDKPESFQGDYFLMSHDDGEGNFEIVEGFQLAANKSEGLLTGYFDNPQPNEILTFNQFGTSAGGTVQSSGVNVNDIMTKIDSASGGKIATTTASGEVAESGTAIADLATQTDLADKMDKISGTAGNKVLMSNASGEAVESYYGVAIQSADESQGFITGYYFNNATEGEIMTYYGDCIRTSGVNISDIATLDYIGTIPQGSSATDVIGYIDEVAGDVGDEMEVTLVEAQTPTTGYLKTYELYQGGNAAANLVGKIDIPKDLVVTSGEIVVNPTGQPAGTYLKLTIANQTAPVYINVADLCDVYTAASGAAQVQLAISATNEISATLVAGGVGTTELAANAVTTAKIADDAVTADKVAISAHTEAQTAGADGLAISVTTTDGQISAVSGSIAANTYEAYGAVSTAIGALDAVADGTKTAVDGSTARTKTNSDAVFALQGITEADGKITAMTVVEAAQIGTGTGRTGSGTQADPYVYADNIKGTKTYVDDSTGSISTASIQALFA